MMTSQFDSYHQTIELFLKMVAVLTSAKKANYVRSLFKNPSQIFINFTERIPIGHIEMGCTLNRMSRREIERELKRADSPRKVRTFQYPDNS